ncbi:MAG: HAD hydrolase-like protein [Gemmatimonadota bacterium]|nr:HAD hydrolase-like protein [Gemmatimonadota bacterium]MDH5759198.1 HAD hydrolase-like protein [Gemmatimonadota bacterium]
MKRLLLFDIDGTLVAGGPAKDAFHQAMLETFGTAGAIDGHSFAGKTDPQIARELLHGVGMPDPDIEAGLPRLWGLYLGYLEERLVARPMDVLPGVDALLGALGKLPEVALGLLTGNIQDGAHLKLRSAGLHWHFSMGSFGSDHEERDELPAIALRRAEETWGVTFHPDDVFVVGDTPRDVQCGRKEGTRTLAVATGRYDARSLWEAGADQVLEDLSDTGTVVSILAG